MMTHHIQHDWLRLRHVAISCWRLLRRVSGDDAYEQYVQHMKLSHGTTQPLAPEEFQRQQQERKWSRISRCC